MSGELEMHSIELSTAAVLATRKLFNTLTESDLIDADFTEDDIEAFGELFLGVREKVEELEMMGEI